MTTKKRLVLHTSDDSVLLKEFVKEDAQPLFELIKNNREHLGQWDDPTSEKYPDFESVLSSITHPRNPAKIRFGIWYNGVLAGTINFTHKPAYTGEIGYWIGSEFCGKGLATIATCTIIDYGFLVSYTKHMTAIARIENIASQRVLKKAGMKEVDRSEEMNRDGKYVYFARDIETDWRTSNV